MLVAGEVYDYWALGPSGGAADETLNRPTTLNLTPPTRTPKGPKGPLMESLWPLIVGIWGCIGG